MWKPHRYGGGATFETVVGDIVVSYDDSSKSREARGGGNWYFSVFGRRSKSNFEDFEKTKRSAVSTARRLLGKAAEELDNG